MLIVDTCQSNTLEHFNTMCEAKLVVTVWTHSACAETLLVLMVADPSQQYEAVHS